MTKTHRIEILCTANEHERIRNNALAKGFPTVSAFVRDLALRNPLTSDERIAEIHSAITRSKLGIEKIADSLLANYGPNLYIRLSTNNQYAPYLPKDYNPQPKLNPIYNPDPLKEPGLQDYQDFDDSDYC